MTTPVSPLSFCEIVVSGAGAKTDALIAGFSYLHQNPSTGFQTSVLLSSKFKVVQQSELDPSMENVFFRDFLDASDLSFNQMQESEPDISKKKPPLRFYVCVANQNASLILTSSIQRRINTVWLQLSDHPELFSGSKQIELKHDVSLDPRDSVHIVPRKAPKNYPLEPKSSYVMKWIPLFFETNFPSELGVTGIDQNGDTLVFQHLVPEPNMPGEYNSYICSLLSDNYAPLPRAAVRDSAAQENTYTKVRIRLPAGKSFYVWPVPSGSPSDQTLKWTHTKPYSERTMRLFFRYENGSIVRGSCRVTAPNE